MRAAPAGRGHCYSYIKRPEVRPAPGEEATAQPPRPPDLGSITGSEADLRKLSTKEAARILLDFGVAAHVVETVTDRWVGVGTVGVLAQAHSGPGGGRGLAERPHVLMQREAGSPARGNEELHRAWQS